MMSVMSFTPSPPVSAFRRTYTHLSGMFYDFLELLEAHDFPREALLELYFIYIVAWGNTWGVRHYPLDPPWALFMFILSYWVGSPLLGWFCPLMCLLLYWSMYFMLSSSQPLIRTFWSFNLNHPFERWLGFCYLSFLFKGESFSLWRGERSRDFWLWAIGIKYFLGHLGIGMLWWL